MDVKQNIKLRDWGRWKLGRVGGSVEKEQKTDKKLWRFSQFFPIQGVGVKGFENLWRALEGGVMNLELLKATLMGIE
jgi:hypothetical protein